MTSTHPSRFRRGALKQEFAAQIRAEPTEAERKLWALLRRNQIAGVRSRRQQPVGPYIVDFFCSAAKLIVELDGDQHGADKAVHYDEARSLWLTKQGYTVLRFPNRDVFQNPQIIVDGIVQAFEECGLTLPPSP